MQALQNFWEWIRALVVEDIYPAINYMFSTAINSIGGTFNSAKEYIFDYLRGFAPMTPEKVPEAAAVILGSTITFGMAAHTISVVTEAFHPFKRLGLHYLAGFLGDMGGFGVISAAVMGTLVYTAIRLPYSYYLNKLFRPKIPDEQLLNMMHAKREISKGEYYQMMQYHGYTDNLIDSQYRYLWMDPRLFEIIRISEVTSPPEEPVQEAADWLARANIIPKDERDWWYFLKFGKAGYDDIDLPILADAARFSVKRREQTMNLMRIRELYREGLIPDPEARERLAEEGLKSDVIEVRMRGMIMEKGFRMGTGGKADLLFQFRNDQITEDDLMLGLSTLGYQDDMANFILKKEIMRKKPKIAQAEKKAEEKAVREMQSAQQKLYREMFKSGLIDSDTYESYLIAIGITPEMSSVVVAIEVAKMYEDPNVTKQKSAEKLIAAIQKENVERYKLLYKAQRISKYELITYLILAGVNKQFAYAIANTEEARLLEPPETVETE